MSIYINEPKDSSFIKSIGWSSLAMTLVIEFKSGSIWAYHRVPKKVYESLISAPSVGNYFNLTIRDTYSSERISFASEQSGPVNIEQETKKQEQSQT
jgi:hypothetical protein